MDRDVVERVAKAARISLTDDELNEFSKDLEDLLNYFDIMDSAPVTDSGDMAEGIFREDVPVREYDPKDLLKDMKLYDGYVRGPRLS